MFGFIASNIVFIINGNVAAYMVNEYNAIYLTRSLINIENSNETETTIKQSNNR